MSSNTIETKDTGNPWVLKSLGDSERHRQELDERVAATLCLTKEQYEKHKQERCAELMFNFKKRLREEGRRIGPQFVKEY